MCFTWNSPEKYMMVRNGRRTKTEITTEILIGHLNLSNSLRESKEFRESL
jgi:hypothetical protein